MFHRNASIALLLLAAILEAGGDDAVRKALHISTPPVVHRRRAGPVCVRLCRVCPCMELRALIGTIRGFFFVIAQLMSWLFFGQSPSFALILGGGLIDAGGLVKGPAACYEVELPPALTGRQ